MDTPFPLLTDNNRYYRDAADAFGVKLSVQEARAVPEHAHGNIQISIPLGDTVVEASWRAPNGSLRRSVARRGHVLIIPPQQRHAIQWQHAAYFVNLHIDPLLASDRTTAFLHGIGKAGEAHVHEDPFLSRLAERIVLIAGSGVELDDGLLRGFRLIVESHIICSYAFDPRPISASLATQPRSAKGLAAWQLRKIMKNIEADLRRDRTVAELAASIGLSMGHFSRAFRASTGMSPRQWIIHKRLQMALDKLAHTNAPLAEICRQCGFADQSYFTRQFKQLTGTSPAAWRRANRMH